MALFTLADLHLSLSGKKPMDIFGSTWSNFEARLKEYWEYMVSKDDTVVIPGDISWAMNLDEIEEDFAFIHALPGTKVLMKGNHDYWWTSLSKLNAFCEEKGFSTLRFLQNDAIYAQGMILCGSRGWMCEDKMTEHDEKILRREAMRFEMSIQMGKKIQDQITQETKTPAEIICFSHYPVITATQRENPILDVLRTNGIKRVYYGHLHNHFNKPLYEEYGGIQFTLVSADYRRFTPVRIEQNILS